MPLPSEYNLPPTKDPGEFEDMVCDVCIKRFGRGFQRYGRSGQRQSGIDIISTGAEKLIGIQCKNYELSAKEIENIIEEARKFKQPMAEFNHLINKYYILDYVKEDPVVGMPKYYPELVDSFLWEMRQALSRENSMQQHPRFAAMVWQD